MRFLNRRGVFAAVLAASGAAPVLASATPAKLRVVYHLADLNKVNFVLGNMLNHIMGVGGPDKIKLAVVVHGPALAAFTRVDENIAVSEPMAALLQSGVGFHACGNTLKGMKMTVNDLLSGFVEAPEGGVVKLASLQADGWIYLRP